MIPRRAILVRDLLRQVFAAWLSVGLTSFVTSHPYITSVRPSITTFPGPMTTFESLKYPGNYLSIDSNGKLTTVSNDYGPEGLVDYFNSNPDDPNPWFRLNYTGQHRLRNRLCDASLDRDPICVGSRALVGEPDNLSASDEEEVLWRVELNAHESEAYEDSWSVYLELASRGLICLEFNFNHFEPNASSLQPYFEEIDLDDTAVNKSCLFVATTY